MSRSPLRPGFLLIPLVLAWFAFSPAIRAVDPPPDGGYPNQNTAEGEDALFSLTTGFGNTAIGFNALFSNTTGSFNTANGDLALQSNTTGVSNTATGAALQSNTTGSLNTATGAAALASNTTGNANTANGDFAGRSNTTGSNNTADGYIALPHNTTGNNNTASGDSALFHNITGNNNTATGMSALYGNKSGNNNIALGAGAGANLIRGDDNIAIGNPGDGQDSNTIRIGNPAKQSVTFIAGISGATVAGGVTVIVDTSGHLGTVTSSVRFKDAIKPMDKASEAILALKPVTFRYKHQLDPDGIPQFGLVAEQVEKVNPDLVARDETGKPYTVRYEAVNAMLLNEFLKEHRKVESQDKRVQELETTVAQLKSALKEQASLIQKVSDQLEVSQAAPRIVSNNQ